MHFFRISDFGIINVSPLEISKCFCQTKKSIFVALLFQNHGKFQCGISYLHVNFTRSPAMQLRLLVISLSVNSDDFLRMIWTQYIDIIFRCAHNLEQRYYKSPTLVASIIIHCVTMGSSIRLLFVFILLISVAFAYWPEQEPEKCIESGGTVSYKIIFVFEKSQLFISYNFQCAVFNMVKCCQPLNCYVTKSIKYGECGWSTTVPVLLVDISLYWIEFEIEIQFPSHRYPFNIVLFRVCVCVFWKCSATYEEIKIK